MDADVDILTLMHSSTGRPGVRKSGCILAASRLEMTIMMKITGLRVMQAPVV